MKANYDEQTVVAQLNKKADIQIDSDSSAIQIIKEPHGRGDIGIKSKGKIDFLTNHCGYWLELVTKFTRR